VKARRTVITFPSLLVWTGVLSACISCNGTSTASVDAGDTNTEFSGDTDTGSSADTDTQLDAGMDAGTPDRECAPDVGNLKWKPLPKGLDCGPGCQQLTFEAVNSMTGWDVSEQYLAATPDEPYANGFVVDLKSLCRADIVVPVQRGDVSLFTHLSVFRQRVVNAVNWSGKEMNQKGILHTNLQTGEQQSLLYEEEPNVSSTRYHTVSLHEDRVAFLHPEPSSADKLARLFNIKTSEVKTLSDTPKVLFEIRQSENHVVWMDVTDSKSADIWVHEIATEQTWNLSNHASTQIFPRIDGNRVVWTDLRNGSGSYWGGYENADVYLHDFDKKELFRITDGAWIQARPDISGDRIVWQDHRDCSDPNSKNDFSQVNVWMHDLNTGENHQITEFDGSESAPRIEGNKVFYIRRVETNNYARIFVQDLTQLGL
jgi:beta propeller repeat protein